MTSKMVISCFPNGRAEHTLRDGKFNPFPGQRRHITRLSEIMFDNERQQFFVLWLRGPFAGHPATWFNTVDNLFPLRAFVGSIVTAYETWDCVLFFDTYEEAVAHEINIADALRQRGESFSS